MSAIGNDGNVGGRSAGPLAAGEPPRPPALLPEPRRSRERAALPPPPSARDEARAVDDTEPGQRTAHRAAFLRCWPRASMTRASASFSVRPVAVTPYATAVATHSRASFWWTSTSNFTGRKLTPERAPGESSRARRELVAPGKDRVARGLVGDRVVVLGGHRAAHADGAHDLTAIDQRYRAAAEHE